MTAYLTGVAGSPEQEQEQEQRGRDTRAADEAGLPVRGMSGGWGSGLDTPSTLDGEVYDRGSGFDSDESCNRGSGCNDSGSEHEQGAGGLAHSMALYSMAIFAYSYYTIAVQC